MKNKFDYKFELLLKEIDLLQRKVESYDSIAFKIKGWAVTIFSGFLIVSAKENRIDYLLVCIFAVLMFWSIENTFKSFQKRIGNRAIEIEEFLNSNRFNESIDKQDITDIKVPSLVLSFKNMPFKDKLRISIKSLFTFNVSGFYISLLLMVILMAIWIKFDI